MDSRERIQRLMVGEPADGCGFWLGNPHQDTWPIYHRYFGTKTKVILHSCGAMWILRKWPMNFDEKRDRNVRLTI